MTCVDRSTLQEVLRDYISWGFELEPTADTLPEDPPAEILVGFPKLDEWQLIDLYRFRLTPCSLYRAWESEEAEIEGDPKS